MNTPVPMHWACCYAETVITYQFSLPLYTTCTGRINFYKLASIFVRPVPEALRALLLKVVSQHFPGGKWSISDFSEFMGKDTSKMPSMSPSEDDPRVVKEWRKKWRKFLQGPNFSVNEEQVPHLLSDNCDKWDVTLLFCVLCKVNEFGKLSEDAGVFKGVRSLKNLRNDEYGHRSNDTATEDELEEVIRQVIEHIEKLGPVLLETVEKFIKDVQDIRKGMYYVLCSYKDCIAYTLYTTAKERSRRSGRNVPFSCSRHGR